VFPGNRADITTITKVKEDLKGWKLGRALFVADSGMNSDESRLELARGCGKYLLAARMGSVKEVKEKVLTRRGRYQVISENLHVKEAVVGDGARKVRYILCYNPKEAERQRKHREKVVGQIERIFSRHKDNNALAQWAIELKASRRYGKYMRIRSDKTIEIDQDAIKEAERYDGKWVVQTNDDTLTAEDAASGYKALLVIERCFRSLKRTQVKMTPMFHWLPRRIETHVKICVLALLIERMAELSCGKTWMRMRESLRSLGVSKFRTETHYFFQRNEPSFEVNSILKSLKISLPNKVLSVELHS
jgi:transposase